MDQRGWVPGIEHVPTQAFGYADVAPGSMRALAVMSHIMQGYQRTMLAWANERPYATPKSAHFTIGRGGRVVQHVGIFDPAWAAGYVNRPTWPLYRAGTNPNKYLIHIEHEGFSVPPGYGFDYVYTSARPWPASMVEASIEVHRWVFDQLDLEPAPPTITGHFEVDAVNRANDPGLLWPRKTVIEALSASAAPKVGDRVLFDHQSKRWPDGDVPRLIQATIDGRVRGHRYVEWRGRVVPSMIVLEAPNADARAPST